MRKTSEKPKAKRGKSGSDADAAVTEAAGDGLSLYRQKRDPARTNEPFAAPEVVPGRDDRTLQGRFVVHQHAATRMHYDLRIQVGSALKSFAVPKGPSLNPEDKRLAVNTEDHPLEYLEFEDVIPEGNYGAGAMIAWDTGRISYLEGSAEEGIARGKIDFLLSGFKLNGRFALVRTGHRGAKKPNEITPEWLLLKKTDKYSKGEGDLLTELPRSIFSGMTVEELRSAAELVEGLEQSAARLGARRQPFDASGVEPMRCALEGAELDDETRLYELKLDGVRIIADKSGEKVQLRYRNGRSATANYPEIARAVRSLAPERLVLDGEIVAFDAEGRPSFQRLGPRIQARKPLDVARVQEQVPVVYLVFDLLQLGSWNLLEVPLVARKQLLQQLVRGKGYLHGLDHLEKDGRPLFELCRQTSLEGVVAKRMLSKYRPGPARSDDWVKIKTEREDDFVVVGMVPGRGQRRGLGALCVASYRGDDLVLRGRVGSGLDDHTLRALGDELAAAKQAEYPCQGDVPPDLKAATFVRPQVVVGVRYLGWTDEGRLRHPVFRGLRNDVEPADCRAHPPAQLELELAPDQASADSEFEPSGDTASIDTASAGAVSLRRVQLSNQDKIFWPEEGYTKGDVCEYYATVADAMLPFLKGRPVVLVRYPDGIAGKSFYQWRAPAGTPDWIRTLELRDDESQQEKGEKRAFLLDSPEALLHIANLGCIPIHVLACREHARESCDFLTIDLDIGEQPFKHAVVLALTLRELLSELELSGFPKTSGQKGLHVLIPTGGIDFDSAKLLVELLGRLLVARHPDISTMERRVGKRGPKVYVDTGQTGHSRTIVAPYSVRATAGATVSTPLLWDEVHVALDPTRFTMFTVPSRVARLGDPMAAMLDETPDIARAVAVLGQRLS